jgi:tripartite-type tricarboxylate transporter receptor subunit TctC
VRFINQPDAKEKLLNAGQDIVGSSPAELRATMKSEMAKWSKLIKEARITAD